MPKVIYHDSEGVDRTVPLGSDPVLIGRATECHIQTQDAMVSRRHARITWDGNYWIEDLGSSNGVYVGTERVQRAPFRIGDTITCGSLVLKMVPDTAPRASQPGTGAAPGGTPPMGAPSLPSTVPPPVAPPRTTAPNAAPPPAAPLPSYGAPPPYPGPPAATGPRTAAFDASGNIIPQGAPPPVAPPPVAPPPVAPPPVAVPPPAAVPSGPSGPSAAELESERRRRIQAEEALLAAEERARIAETRAKEAEAAGKEAMLLKRRVDQLTADLKRMRGGQAPDGSAGGDDGRLAAAEAERDQLRARVAELERSGGRGGGGGGGGGISTQAADTLVLLSDALAELRASMRAANDEAALLTAPRESVEVIGDALRTAAEQLETARERLRTLGKLLGVS